MKDLNLPAASAGQRPCEDPRAVRGRLSRIARSGNWFAAKHLQDFERVHIETASGGDWDEYAAHENGRYQCRCRVCDNLFIGHKRRVTCKACVSSQGEGQLAAAGKDA